MKDFRDTRDVVIYLSRYVFGKTIDFGAGSAKYRNLLEQKSSEYITFDIVAGEHITVVGNALNPPFEDGSCDTIVSNQVLEHVEKPWEVVCQMKRILKPGGVCIITAPFLVPYHADPHDFFRYTKQGMESLFQNEGFIIEESGSYGKLPTVLVEMIHFSYLSHYTKRSGIRKKMRNQVMRFLKWAAFKLGSLSQSEVTYANIYVVARKPKKV